MEYDIRTRRLRRAVDQNILDRLRCDGITSDGTLTTDGSSVGKMKICNGQQYNIYIRSTRLKEVDGVRKLLGSPPESRVSVTVSYTNIGINFKKSLRGVML